MKLNVLACACAALVFAGSAAAVATPGQSLGTVTKDHALFAAFTSIPEAGSFLDSYSFSLDKASEVIGSVGQVFGSVAFSKVWIDDAFVVPSPVLTGYSFTFSGLSAGAHKLKIEGLEQAGFDGYTGSISAVAAASSMGVTPSVPEPGSMALALTAMGMMVWTVRRRAK
jgi:hypothetical protein